jgi:hypothetical protein
VRAPTPNARQREPGAVLINEVGVFGYFYEGPVIDAVGLCSPEALAFYPPPRWDVYDEYGEFRTSANNFAPTEMVLALRPEYVVNSLTYVKNLTRPGSPFHRHYALVGNSGVAWRHPIAFFRRTDAAQRGKHVEVLP